MPFRLVAADPGLEAAVRRIALEQVDGALAALDRLDTIPVASVHALRKCCKKLRGLIRLVRPCFADAARENAAIRDVAALFSASRDAAVMADTIETLRKGLPDDPAFADLYERLLAESQGPAAPAGIVEARRRLADLRHRAEHWAIEGDGWPALSPGLLRTYRAARKGMKQACAGSDADAHHEWRKRVKDHWYQARLLRCLWPEAMTAHADAASALADQLGEHHDLAVLEVRLTRLEDTGEAGARLLRAAQERRAELERSSRHLGARLLADKPQALSRRWRRWWRVWQDERQDPR